MNIKNNKRIKIFKTATNVSLMDVTPLLDYHVEKSDEMSYRGSIGFLINEYGRSKTIIQTFLPKSKAKMVFNSIINGTFMNLFPPNQGYVEYGGSSAKKLARTLRITFELNQQDFSKSRYVFQIDEGEANIGKNGQITMKKGHKPKSVRTYVNVYQAIEMAHEIVDYIRHEELLSLSTNKPLYTWNNYQPKNQNQQNNYNQQPAQPNYNNPPVNQPQQNQFNHQGQQGGFQQPQQMNNMPDGNANYF